MKKYIKYFLFALILSFVFTQFVGFTTIIYGNNTSSENLQENIELDTLKEFAIIEEATVEYLDADAFPAVLEKSEIQEKQYVGRVKVEEKNEYTLVLKNADGTNTLRLFDYPIKYTDETGVEKDITLKLTETAKGDYRTADNKIITTFSQKLSEGISLEYEDIFIQMVPEEQSLALTPITPITPVVPKASDEISTVTELTPITPVTPVIEASISEDNEMVSYPFGNKTTLEYSLTYTGFKEDIVVEEYTGQTEYAFRLYTNGLTLVEEDGSYFLANKNNEIKATIGDIIIFTADERNNTFGSMTYETVTANEEYLMTIHVDADYLKDEKTVYPIRIDPTIEINYESNGAGAIQDVTLNSLQGSSGTSGSIMVGKRETYGISRVLMRFPNLSLSNVASASQITSATVEIRDIMCESTAMTVYCYPFTGNTWTDSTANWSNVSPNSYSTSASASKSISYANGVNLSPRHRYSFNITAIVKGWKSGTYTQSKGIIFKASSSVENGTTYISKTFASYNRSSNQPSLTMVYTPRIELSASVVNLNMNSTQYLYATTYPAGMTVTWTSSDPSIVTVSSNGYLDGIKAGSATITATCTDSSGNSSSTYCRVYVKVPDGVYRIKNSYSHHYLKAQAQVLTNYSNVVQYSYSYEMPENLHQMWRIQYIGSGYYAIRSLRKLNMALYTNGSNVCVYDIGESSTTSTVPSYASWTIETVSGNYLSGSFVFKRQGGWNHTLSLETDSTTTNTNVNIQTMENYQRQIWKLERISTLSEGTFLYDTEKKGIVTNPTEYVAPGEVLSLSDLNLEAVFYSLTSMSQRFVWSTSDSAIATVDAGTGQIAGLRPGTVTIRGVPRSASSLSVEFTLIVTPIKNGTYYIKSRYSEKYVDINEQSMEAGTIIHQWDYNGEDTQKWNFKRYVDDYYVITSANSTTNFYLGVKGNSSAQDASIILRTGSIQSGMLWKIEETANGAYKIIPKTGVANQRVLAVENGTLGFAVGNGKVIQQRKYENSDAARYEWSITPHHSVLNISVYVDNAYIQRYSNYTTRITNSMQKLQEKYLSEFGILVNYSTPIIFTSSGDYCDEISGGNYNTPCSHGSDTDCRNATPGTAINLASAVHHNNIYNIMSSINAPDLSETTNVIFTGHPTCFVYTNSTQTTEDDSHQGHANGISLKAKGICAIMNFTVEESDATRTLVHEIGHWYDAPDHYGTSGCPSTQELKNQTGLPFKEQCIYGEDRFSPEVQSNLTICDGCLSTIKERAARFSHEE